MLHIISSLVVLLVALGLCFRRRPSWHLKFMVGAFLLDVALVLYIELTRQAVETVAARVRPLLWFHAAVSLGVLVCYVVMIVLGRRLLNGRKASRGTHRNLGIAFCVLRGLNYVTSFMV